jgi:hypothetical protein
MAGEYLEFLETRMSKLENVLMDIVAWNLPATGLFWPNQDGSISDRPMSYGAAYGSNGERDYFRKLAAEGLS